MSRPIGRRCPRAHRRCWVLGPAWLWCPDCGAISHFEPAEVEPGKWSRRWAYPGDNDKALDVQGRWPRPEPKPHNQLDRLAVLGRLTLQERMTLGVTP